MSEFCNKNNDNFQEESAGGRLPAEESDRLEAETKENDVSRDDEQPLFLKKRENDTEFNDEFKKWFYTDDEALGDDDERKSFEGDDFSRELEETASKSGEYSSNGDNQYMDPNDFNDDDYSDVEHMLVPPPKKGNGVFWLVAATMLFISAFAIAILTKYYSGDILELASSDGLPTHEYTDTVENHVYVEEPKHEVYEEKTSWYEDCQKSCVTVICKVKQSYYGKTYESTSLGSGFVVSKDGFIVTNAHVVADASSYSVKFYDGTEANAILIGADSACDLAVLKIRNDIDLHPVSFGDSNQVRVGDFAMAIGTPSGEELYGSMTFGVISGKDRAIDITNSSGQTVITMYLLQTDATLNPGNSGGPLFNMNGQVIGINVMKLSQTYEGIGFAIPSTGAVKIINSLISTGKADYSDAGYVKGGAQLGIEGQTFGSDLREQLGFSRNSPDGVLIKSIQQSSSAYKAGVSQYDIICEFNGTSITSIQQLIQLLSGYSPGDMVSMTIYREGRKNESGEYISYSFALDAVKE